MITSANSFGQMPVPIIGGNNNDCDNSTTYTILNSNPLYYYNWSLSSGGNISNGNGSTSITVDFDQSISNCNFVKLTVTATYLTDASSGFLEIYPCCNDNANYIFNNYTTTSALIFPISSTVIINGDFIMENDVSFDNANVYVSPNSKIILNKQNITLSIINGTDISSTINCCTDMWDGIYTNNNTQHVNIQNSGIHNAQHAVNIYQASSFLIELSDFTDNYQNIYIYQGSGGGTPPYNGIIRGNSFVGSNSLLHHPYQGVQTYSGIEVFRTDLLTIGDPSSSSYTNHFNNMFCGIKTEQSFVNVYNNEFFDINLNTSAAGIDPTFQYNSTAIFSIGDPILTPGNYLWQGSKIGGSGLYSNNFYNCYNGIYGYNLLLKVDNNNLNTTNTGVEGRDLFDDSFVRNNTILGSLSGTSHTRTGISLSNIQPHKCKITVNNNSINAINRGIMITNAYSTASSNLYVQIYSNVINLDGYNIPYDKPNSAIKAANCNGINIYDNNLSISNYSSAADNLFFGIDIAQTTDAFITNNPYINKYGAGINVFGNCNFTQFYCNTLDNCFNGFLFNDQSSITNQGVSDVVNTDNAWIGNYWDTFYSAFRKLWAVPTNLIPPYNVRWFVKYSPPTNMQIQNNIGTNPTNTLIAGFINNINAQSSCMSLPLPATIAINLNERETLYGNIVRDSNSYAALEEQYKTYDKEVLYKAIKENPSIMNLGDASDVLYQDFYTSESGGNIEKIAEIEALIKDNQDSLAMLKNATIQDQKQIDYFRKIVNEIYLTTFAKGSYNLSPEQIDILMPIATEYTPWEGGDAVYIARQILNLDDEALLVDFAKAPVSTKSVEADRNAAKLYPNPATNEVMIEFDNVLKANAMFEIYNFTGVKIQNMPLNTGNQLISVSTKDLKAGIYMYRILINEEVIAKDKLLIVK